MSDIKDMADRDKEFIARNPRILLAHGGGGRAMHQLIANIFRVSFDNPALETDHDGAVVDWDGERLVFSTDSYVVDPLFFPGGNIGDLAVYGTVNDLAMCGAKPMYLSASFIIEEGLETEKLHQIAQSMKEAAEKADVRIITGDTKVVEKGKGHGVFINTAGVGAVGRRLKIHPENIKAGDIIIINGDIGRHGIAVISAREGMQFETGIESDCAPLAKTVMKLLEGGVELHCLRDLTRGGLATGMIEAATAGGVQAVLEEKAIPVSEPVRGACELLGYDPLYVANEGRFICIAPEKETDKILDILRAQSWGEAAVIGKVTEGKGGMVLMKGILGIERIIDLLSGEQLPRIC